MKRKEKLTTFSSSSYRKKRKEEWEVAGEEEVEFFFKREKALLKVHSLLSFRLLLFTCIKIASPARSHADRKKKKWLLLKATTIKKKETHVLKLWIGGLDTTLSPKQQQKIIKKEIKTKKCFALSLSRGPRADAQVGIQEKEKGDKWVWGRSRIFPQPTCMIVYTFFFFFDLPLFAGFPQSVKEKERGIYANKQAKKKKPRII